MAQRLRTGWLCGLLLLAVVAVAGADDAAPDASASAAVYPVGDAVPDFARIDDVEVRKLSFFEYLVPIVEQENDRLRRDRRRLDYIHDHIRFGRPLLPEDVAWLRMTAEDAGLVVFAPHQPAFWDTLARRTDEVPVELALVQAALESAWGTSRFARQGNNFFGQWCFQPGCGIVPSGRADDASHEVARFATVEQAVRSYLRNLNTGDSYRRFRDIRDDFRRSGRTLDAAAMADGLHAYSELGEGYVDRIRALLRQNRDLIADALQRRHPRTARG